MVGTAGVGGGISCTPAWYITWATSPLSFAWRGLPFSPVGLDITPEMNFRIGPPFFSVGGALDSPCAGIGALLGGAAGGSGLRSSYRTGGGGHGLPAS